MEYKWDQSLETGHSQIDAQHRQLIAALNTLIRTCEEGKGKDELKKSLDFLNDYTIKHFFDEEQLQMQYQYPDFENHRKYHEEFKKIIRNFSVELILKGATESLVKEVQAKLGSWLITHIKGQDVKIAAHIKSRS
ncbi:MAG: hemerythrin family protein [Spirochaetaceae bacterium]|jgi:hemerythrin|nr:hemerythrin family protein [Spirochaetaceae bacterium]